MKPYLLSLFFTISFGLFAQTECSYYHKKFCDLGEGEPMKYDGQSKSAILAKGQISEFHMIAYDGLDYRITVCAEEILGPDVQLKIFEKRKELIKEEDIQQEYQEETVEEVEVNSNQQEGVYDEYSTGSFDDYSDNSYEDAYASYSDEPSAEAANSKSPPKYRRYRELLYDNAEDGYNKMIEFSSDGSMSLILQVIVPGEESASKLKIREMGCVGVLVERAKSRMTGF
jgi:hypothetical protein